MLFRSLQGVGHCGKAQQQLVMHSQNLGLVLGKASADPCSTGQQSSANCKSEAHGRQLLLPGPCTESGKC